MTVRRLKFIMLFVFGWIGLFNLYTWGFGDTYVHSEITVSQMLDKHGLPDRFMIVKMDSRTGGNAEGYLLRLFYYDLELEVVWIYEIDRPSDLGYGDFCPDASYSASRVAYDADMGLSDLALPRGYWGNYMGSKFATYDDVTGTWTINCF